MTKKALLFTITLCLALSLQSCGKGIPGLKNFNVGILQKRLYVNFISTTLQWDYGITVPIPGLNDSTIGVAPDLTSGGTVFQFSIGIETLLNHGKPFAVQGLPDGRPLPGVVDGVLPRWDTDIRGLKLSLYLSDDAFGLFIPLSLRTKKGYTLPWTVSVSIMDERGNALGKAYAIPMNLEEKGSGLFVLLPYLGGAPQEGTPTE